MSESQFQASGRTEEKETVYESNHPCDLHQDRDTHIHFPGATQLTLKFDP